MIRSASTGRAGCAPRGELEAGRRGRKEVRPEARVHRSLHEAT